MLRAGGLFSCGGWKEKVKSFKTNQQIVCLCICCWLQHIQSIISCSWRSSRMPASVRALCRRRTCGLYQRVGTNDINGHSGWRTCWKRQKEENKERALDGWNHHSQTDWQLSFTDCLRWQFSSTCWISWVTASESQLEPKVPDTVKKLVYDGSKVLIFG